MVLNKLDAAEAPFLAVPSSPARVHDGPSNAHLTRRSPHPVENLETRVFECHECGHQTKRVVKA